MKYLLVILIALTGCGGGGSSSKPQPQSVVMYCDSMGLDGEMGSWLDMMGDITQVETYSFCVGGIRIRDYPLEDKIIELGTDHKYAIVALGINDYKDNLIETLNLYEDFILRVEELGMEPVCFTYPANSAIPTTKELNEGIRSICANRKIITSSTQVYDYIHFNNQGKMETAVNAARVMYP